MSDMDSERKSNIILSSLHYVEYLLARFICCVLAWLPLPLLALCARCVGFIGYVLLWKRRKIALENVRKGEVKPIEQVASELGITLS